LVRVLAVIALLGMCVLHRNCLGLCLMLLHLMLCLLMCLCLCLRHCRRLLWATLLLVLHLLLLLLLKLKVLRKIDKRLSPHLLPHRSHLLGRHVWHLGRVEPHTHAALLLEHCMLLLLAHVSLALGVLLLHQRWVHYPHVSMLQVSRTRELTHSRMLLLLRCKHMRLLRL
jgi:hypothetical protein